MSKTRPPRRSRGVIVRPRLDAFLDLARLRPLTTIKAPAGFGKTSLALSWVEALTGSGARVAWLSLAPEDDDDERFLGYMAAAVRHACAGISEVAPDWMLADLSIPADHRIEWLIEELATQPEDIFLFLDDYQEITQPGIHEAITLLLRRAPENVHLIILARVEPAIDLAWLRAHDAVLELDVTDLRFDLNEIQQLLHKGDLGHVRSEDAPALHAMTGGWIAALRAALLTLRMQKNPSQYLHRLPASLRSINTLFADLLDHLPPEVVDFMERISVTERQCASLAERLTGTSGAQSMLLRLEKQQMFFIPQDEDDHWFAFHPLFREVLLRRVREHAEGRLMTMHGEAARWFAEECLWSEAIHHGLAAGEIDLALHWIEQHAMEVVGAGDLLTLLSWERHLRSHLVKSPPQLRLAFAWGLGLAMAGDKALHLLNGVEAELDDAASGVDATLRHECQALRSVLLTMTGDYELGEKLAEQCLAQPALQPWVPNAIRNVIAGAHLHAGRWERLYEAPPVLGDIYEEHPGDLLSLVYRLSIRGLAEYRQGHLDEAAQLLEDAMDMVTQAGCHSVVLKGLPAPTLALVRYEQDRIREAANINAEHMDVNKRIGPIQGLYAAYQVAARAARLGGEPIKARNLLDEGESIGAARGWRRVEVAMLLEKVRFCLLDGRSTEASACARRIETLASESSGRSDLESVEFSQAAGLAHAWQQLADRDFENAARNLEAQLSAIAGSGKLLDENRIATALALAELGNGKTDTAIRIFSETCCRACSVGALRSILDQPVPLDAMIGALRADTAAMTAQPCLQKFLNDLTAATREPAHPGTCASSVELLTPRERHIVNLMAAGRSNKEIARGLGVGPETVKTHIKRIFAKLGIQNRAQAAAFAVDGNPSFGALPFRAGRQPGAAG